LDLGELPLEILFWMGFVSEGKVFISLDLLHNSSMLLFFVAFNYLNREIGLIV
jgi:hypothetical protein